MTAQSPHTFTTNNALYQILPNDILYVRHSGRAPDFSNPEENMLALVDQLQGKKFKILMNNTGFPYAGKQMRVISMQMLEQICSALAIVAETKEGQGIASIFIAGNETECPMKMFEGEEEARVWLESLK